MNILRVILLFFICNISLINNIFSQNVYSKDFQNYNIDYNLIIKILDNNEIEKTSFLLISNNINYELLIYAQKLMINNCDTIHLIKLYNAIGQLLTENNAYSKALDFFNNSLNLNKQIFDTLGIATNYYYIAKTYYQSTNYFNKNNLESLILAKLFAKMAQDKFDYNYSAKYIEIKKLNWILLGNIYNELTKLTNNDCFNDSTLYFIEKSQNSINKNTFSEIELNLLLYNYYLYNNQIDEAQNILLVTKNILEKNISFSNTKNNYLKYQLNYYLSNHKYDSAYSVYQELLSKNKINNQKLLTNYSIKEFVTEISSNDEIEIINENNTITNDNQLKYLIYSVIIFFILTISVVLIAKKIHNINNSLVEKNKSLQLSGEEYYKQNDILMQQKAVVERVNNELLESFKFASYIQRAAMPHFSNIWKLFPESFIYYQPRDIVSGDFIYFDIKNSQKIIAVADCTGHGVPGGFLSMLGITALKDIIAKLNSEEINPGLILDKLRIFIKSSLGNNDNKMSNSDGMDMTLCIFNNDNTIMKYAISNQCIMLYNNGKITRLNGDRMPIGYFFIEKEHFTNYSINLEIGNIIYMPTDGLQDQIGGLENCKLTSSKLVEFLANNSKLPFNMQRSNIYDFMSEWQGNRQQTDDMTMVAIRI
ncbi:MAG: SpoIIE family protein phosphatase [Bacteroidales bacterium]|nr:SpoIIE family protein phosphatase [Bacteroidales bacterium]